MIPGEYFIKDDEIELNKGRKGLTLTVANSAATARSRSPGDFGDSTNTATVLTAEASHQPASRSGIALTDPAEATGST